MMAWPNLSALQVIDLVHIGVLYPVEVLYQFEQPCIFTANLPSGSQVLAYLVEELEQEECYRYLLATTAVETIADLKAGVLSVRKALLRGSLWLADLGMSDLLPKQVFSISVEQLPVDALPEPGTMLLPSLEPALRVRLSGEQITFDALPAPVLAHAADIARTALKPIFDWLARGLTGQTSKDARQNGCVNSTACRFSTSHLAVSRSPCGSPVSAIQTPRNFWPNSTVPMKLNSFKRKDGRTYDKALTG